jgi:hypothetical protein
MLVDAPARQNASAIHTSTSSRSIGGGGGLNGSILALSRFNMRQEKRAEGALFPISGEFQPICAVLVP